VRFGAAVLICPAKPQLRGYFRHARRTEKPHLRKSRTHFSTITSSYLMSIEDREVQHPKEAKENYNVLRSAIGFRHQWAISQKSTVRIVEGTTLNKDIKYSFARCVIKSSRSCKKGQW